MHDKDDQNYNNIFFRTANILVDSKLSFRPVFC